MWYENCCRSVKMSIYIVMHHAHTAQRGRETFRFAHTCRKIKISTYVYIYIYIYSFVYKSS